MADVSVPGYLDVWGGRSKAAIVDHKGPTSYVPGGEGFGTQSTLGGPNSLGLSGINWCSQGYTESGSYSVLPIFGGGGSVKSPIKLKWVNSVAGQSAAGVPLNLGPLSAAATQSTFTANGVMTVVGANSLVAGQFILLTNGAANAGIFMNGTIVQVVSATPTSYVFNFATAKALNYTIATDTLKYQVVQASSNNLLQSGASVAVSAVAVATNVLTVTCANTANTIVPGMFVVLQGLAAGEVPQGAIVQVLTASTTQFTANLIAPNLSATSGETGTATILVTNGQAPISAVTDSQSISGTTVAATARTASAAGAITVLPVTNNFVPGNIIVIQGLTHGSTLNGLITPVLAASLSPTNVTTNGYIAAAVATGTSDLGVAAVLTTGAPTLTGEVAAGTNLSGEVIRLLVIGG